MPADSGLYAFEEPTSETGRMDVHFHRPAEWRQDGPVLIALHGYKRNADVYAHDWKPIAEEHGALLLAPEFDHSGYPTPRSYEVGAMRTPDRKAFTPAELWSWGAVERAFDAARVRFGASRASYWLYGHSAGGQFVHRLALYCPAARFSHVIAANAGAYSATNGQRFPYGLGHPAPEPDVAAFLGRRLTILLGQKDRKTKGGVLLRSPEALVQGPHRLARGRYFYQTGMKTAARLGAPFRWRLVEAPDAAHSNRALAPIAGRLFAAGDAEGPAA
ncbi:MAG: hypothetical protein RIM80_23830 [Alphaproteobacteria bacterium]